MRWKNFLRIIIEILTILSVTLMLSGMAGAQSKYKTLYKFKGGADGCRPAFGLVLDAAGNLYGATEDGGNPECSGQYVNGCGVIFQLKPNANGSWTERAIHRFTGKDGLNPQGSDAGSLTLDGQGNLYGTTFIGGKGDCNGYGRGVAFELIPNADGSWKEKVLHYFAGDVGVNPQSNLMFDALGNLYGTTSDWSQSFTGPGTVLQLAPNSDGIWTKHTLLTFNSTDGYNPSCGLVRDPAGNLYGTTDLGGAYGGALSIN